MDYDAMSEEEKKYVMQRVDFGDNADLKATDGRGNSLSNLLHNSSQPSAT